jgi:hypothetical protein
MEGDDCQDENPRAVIGDNSRSGDVWRTAEEIAETAKFLRNNASPDAPYRSRALAVAVVAPITDAAFRLYALRLIFANSEGEDCFPSQKTLGRLLGKNERHIRRLDEELKQELCPDIRLITTTRRRRASATFNLITGIAMDRLIGELSGGLDRTEMSGQEVQERTGMSYQDGQDREEIAAQDVKTGHFGFKTGQECPPTLDKDPIKSSNARARRSKSRISLADEALLLYNDGARHHGWSVCHSLTDHRRKRFDNRLAEIGGIEPFTLALSAIPRNDFLMGRRPPRDGGAPFRLDLDRLLSTDSGMGDVLARLIDDASDAQVNGTAHGMEADVARLAETPAGKRKILEKGREAALAEFRKLVLSRVKGAEHVR